MQIGVFISEEGEARELKHSGGGLLTTSLKSGLCSCNQEMAAILPFPSPPASSLSQETKKRIFLLNSSTTYTPVFTYSQYFWSGALAFKGPSSHTPVCGLPMFPGLKWSNRRIFRLTLQDCGLVAYWEFLSGSRSCFLHLGDPDLSRGYFLFFIFLFYIVHRSL